jgi:hypothetical protein
MSRCLSSNVTVFSEEYMVKNAWNIYLWPFWGAGSVLLEWLWKIARNSGWMTCVSVGIFTRDTKRDCNHLTATLGYSSRQFLSASWVVTKHLQLEQHREITSQLIYSFCLPFATVVCWGYEVLCVHNTHIHTRTHTHAHTHTQTRIRTHTRIHTRARTHTHTHTHIHTRIHTRSHTRAHIHTRARTHTRNRAHTHTHILEHAYTYTEAHTYTHTLIHTHTHITRVHIHRSTSVHTHTHTRAGSQTLARTNAQPFPVTQTYEYVPTEGGHTAHSKTQLPFLLRLFPWSPQSGGSWRR